MGGRGGVRGRVGCVIQGYMTWGNNGKVCKMVGNGIGRMGTAKNSLKRAKMGGRGQDRDG